MYRRWVASSNATRRTRSTSVGVGAATQGLARLLEFPVTGRPVDGPVDAAPTGQRLVGGVDHGVHLLGRDVALHCLNIHDVTLLFPRIFVPSRALSPCARRPK